MSSPAPGWHCFGDNQVCAAMVHLVSPTFQACIKPQIPTVLLLPRYAASLNPSWFAMPLLVCYASPVLLFPCYVASLDPSCSAVSLLFCYCPPVLLLSWYAAS